MLAAMNVPQSETLILTHILQTEVKSKLSALKKRLQREPALPDSSPERRDHHGSVTRRATQACQLLSRSVPTVMVRGD